MLIGVIASENSKKIIVVLRAKLSGDCLVVTGVEDEVLSEPGMVIVEKLRGDVSGFVVNFCINKDAHCIGEVLKRGFSFLET